MKKFEIINDKLIRVVSNYPGIQICKIASISQIILGKAGNAIDYEIQIYNTAHKINIPYSASEHELAKTDFAFLENLLCDK